MQRLLLKLARPVSKPLFGVPLPAGIYLLRGLEGVVVEGIGNNFSINETVFSLIAILIGLAYLFGGVKTFWANKSLRGGKG